MTAQEAEVLTLPVRPTGQEHESAAQAGTRTREEGQKPQKVTALTVPVIARVFSGASVIHGAPPPIMGYWAQHRTAAEYFNSRALRWPRYAYGAWHSFVEVPVLYFLAWSGDSPPKRAGFLLVAAAFVLIVLGVIHT